VHALMKVPRTHILMMQGIRDHLFPIWTDYSGFQCASSLGGDVRYWTYQFGHNTTGGNPSAYNPDDDPPYTPAGNDSNTGCGSLTHDAAVLQWFNEKLKGQANSAGFIPKICISLTAGDGVAGYHGDYIPAALPFFLPPAGLARGRARNLGSAARLNRRVREGLAQPVGITQDAQAVVVQNTGDAPLNIASIFALELALILIAPNAMRVGLLPRFLGYCGMVVGVAGMLLLGSAPEAAPPIFSLPSRASLFAGRWTAAEPPAWPHGRRAPVPSTPQRPGQPLRLGNFAA